MVLSGELQWKAHSIACEVSNHVIPERFQENFVKKIQRDKENICNELQVIYRGHHIYLTDHSFSITRPSTETVIIYILLVSTSCNPKEQRLEVGEMFYYLTVTFLLKTSICWMHLVPMNVIICYIEGYLPRHPNCEIKKDFLCAKMAAKTSTLTNSHFVYKTNFNDSLTLWNEFFSLWLANCLQKYPIIPGVTAVYTGREGQQFGKHEDSKFYLFHGSPDIVIKRTDEENVRSLSKNVAVLDKEAKKDSMASEDNEMAGDNDIAVIENKDRQVDTTIVDNVSIPEEITEALAQYSYCLS